MSPVNSDSAIKKDIRKIRLVAFDFDGVFTDNMVYVLQDGTEAVRCHRGDGIGLQKLKKIGIETVIISTEANPVVSARARKLKIRCYQDCRDKRKMLESLAQRLGISLDEVAFVGNDPLHDLALGELHGLSHGRREVDVPLLTLSAFDDLDFGRKAHGLESSYITR